MLREMLFVLSQKVIINVCMEIILVIDRMLFMKVIDTAFLNTKSPNEKDTFCECP